MNEACENIITTDVCEEIDVSEAETEEFISFLDSQQNFLDTGLGAFHTDNHSNW